MNRRHLIILLLILSSRFLNAQAIVENEKLTNIGDQIGFFIDKSCEQGNNFKSFEYQKGEVKVPLFEGTECYWGKLNVSNNTDEDMLVLEVYNPYIDEVKVRYSIGDQNYEARQGKLVPRSEWTYELPNLIFDIHLKKGESTTLYFEINSEEQFNFPVNIGTKDQILNGNYSDLVFYGIYAGIMLVMFFYNLFLYFSIRDRSYLYYVVHTGFVLLTQTAFFGFGYLYLWPGLPGLNKISFVLFTCLVSLAGIRFFFEFLRVKRKAKAFYKTIRVIELVYVLIILLEIVGYRDVAYKILFPVQGLVAITIYIGSLKILRNGFRPARIFVLSWTVLLMGIIIFSLKDFAILPYNYFTLHTIQVGSALEAILLSLALANRINTLKKEKELSQRRTVSALKENERIVKEQNIELEKRVKIRTMELQESNEELESTLTNLKETQTQLVDAEKMASLGQLTAGIAHEINNPINFVTSNVTPLRRDLSEIYEIVETYSAVNVKNANETLEKAHALKVEYDFDFLKEEIDTLVSGISDGAIRTQEIVQGLKTFSRLDEDDVKLIDITEGLDSTLVILRSKTKDQVDIIKEYDEEVPLIECFPGKLNQVFMNILNNALYAVENKVYQEGEKAQITLKTERSNVDVNVYIRDNGIGMDENTQKKLFEPFFTTKDVGEGTGLGMSIVFKIIEKHQGKIKLKSELGKGSEFLITLPLRQPKDS
tara:strand:- start:1063 stop:3195 length:2133 start_codon:yes stop_codon:yes gene_type:complete